MTEERACPQCGKAIPADAPGGDLCPQCLIRQALPSQSPTRSGVGSRFVPPTPEELAPRFQHLEILSLLGQGGMGAVYKALQKNLDRQVALKILSSASARGPAFADRFTREARTLARLSHPSIVAIHDFGDADGLFYFVMEYVDGANLREILRAGKLSTKEVLAIIPQLCDALQYAHDEGVVHRDIKPENILLDQKGRVKIADFGLAKMLDPGDWDITLTVPGEVMGTPTYMAPEQIERPGEVDHRADLFSLGVVFYEMLTGELPLGRFPPPSRKAQVDVRLDDVVLRTLEKEPELRYQSASEIKSEVEFLMGSPEVAAPPVSYAAAAASAAPPVSGSPPAASTPADGGMRTVHLRRPKSVVWVAVYFFLLAGFLFVQMSGSGISIARGAWGFFAWIIAILHIVTGIGLLRLRSRARKHAIALAILGLVLIPGGILFSILTLVCLCRAGMARVFELGEGPATVPAKEAAILEKRMRKA